MSLPHGILGFLSYGSMTGYDLSKAFASSVKFFWHAQASHIYLELTKLEQKGFVTREFIMQTEKPNKKLYSITESGKSEFISWLIGAVNSIFPALLGIFTVWFQKWYPAYYARKF